MDGGYNIVLHGDGESVLSTCSRIGSSILLDDTGTVAIVVRLGSPTESRRTAFVEKYVASESETPSHIDGNCESPVVSISRRGSDSPRRRCTV